MDWLKLLDIVDKLARPDLIERGMRIAQDMAEFVDVVRANAAQAEHVLTAGDRVEIDAIHADTLAVIDATIAKLDAAARQ